jgi:hypothetical protein
VCTVILRVPETAGDPVRMLAVRDEDPDRPWQPLGEWWPSQPGVVGVRDLRAGGAWLAAAASARPLPVLLNRHTPQVPEGGSPVSRGSVALDAVAGRAVQPTQAMPGFNLVDIRPDGVRVITWDGTSREELLVPPGTHMIAHHDLNDPRTARIVAWHDAFAGASTEDASAEDASADAVSVEGGAHPTIGGVGAASWARPWLEILARSAELDPADERAIIRDNRPAGWPTQSLLMCVASVTADDLEVEYGAFAHPGRWNPVDLVPPIASGE